VTNYGTLAILALPWMPERQLRFLLALETVTVRDGGWREVETGVLAAQARQSVRSAVRARAELVKAGRIEYRPGTGPGHPGRYRLLFDMDRPPRSTGATTVHGSTDATSVHGSTGERTVHGSTHATSVHGSTGESRPLEAMQTGSPKPTTDNAVTRANASIALDL
jgi:hypothetical protein